MWLTNVAVVNWHTYGITDIAIEGQIIGLIGDNGHGKSTVLDACQVVLTGGVEGVKLNKRAAGAAAKDAPEEKRSIHSYCLGRLDPKTTLRSECYTYVALSFEDPARLKPPVSLLLCFSATSENTKAHLEARAIIKGAVIKTTDIVNRTFDGQNVIEDWDDTKKRLDAKIAAAGGSMTLYPSTAKEFQEDYMLALMYRGQFSVRKQYLKNMENSIAFTNVDSATEFVQKYVLPEDPIDIQSLRSSAALFNTLLERVTEVEKQIETLNGLATTLERRRDQEIEADREKAVAAFASAHGARRTRRGLVREHSGLARDLEKKSAESASVEGEIKRLETKRTLLLERRAAIGNVRELKMKKDLLASLQKQHDQRLADVLGTNGLGRMAHFARHKLESLAVAPELLDGFVALNTSVSGIGNPSREYLPGDFAKADGAFRDIVSRLSASLAQVEREQNQLLVKQDEADRHLAEIDTKIAAINSSGPRHEGHTSRFVRTLEDNGIMAHVLCDIVDLADEDWRDAVEALMGGDRDVIFVAPEHHAEALRLQRTERTPESVRIATVGKLGRHDTRMRDNSVTSLLTSDNAYARAFLDIKYGSIQLAASDKDFDRPGRWLTKDAQFEDGTSARNLKKTEPRIGRAAAAKALPMLNAQRQECVSTVSALNARVASQQALVNALKSFQDLAARIPSPETPFGAAVEDSNTLTATIEATLEDIERIEESNDTSSIDLEIAEGDEELERLKVAFKDTLRAVGTLQTRRDDAQKKLDGGINTPGSKAFTDRANAELKTTLSGLDLPHERVAYFRAYAGRIAEGDNPTAIREAADRKAQNARRALDLGRGDATAQAEACIELLNAGTDLPAERSLVGIVLPWAVSTRDDLKANVLFDYREQMKKAVEQGEQMFKNGFLNALAERFGRVKDQIRNLNKIIKGTAFLGEVYQISIVQAPGREVFHTAVEAHDKIYAATSGGGLLASILSEAETAAMEEIKGMIFNGQTAVDLDEFTDYRQYFAFDLLMTHEETGVTNNLRSRRATGSGGEVQTPYYICLMAAMSNVYYGGPYKDLKANEGGLCLAIFDEAFSNMDEKVTGQVIDLGKRLGLQLLICGPSNKKVTMQRNCDTVLTVMRSSDKRRTNIYGEYIHANTRDELLALDPRMMTDEQVIDLKARSAA
ncbi:SbcC/MukB-like Walker B domain-containing protein [Agrobacterium salinitolerans]|nr:SbcC/MukB-like Walker B domain-containing protein [Agrobacterium salinitolerans]